MFLLKQRQPSWTVCALLAAHTVYASCYILGLQTHRFYRHAGRHFRAYVRRLMHRTVRVLFLLFIEPFALLVRGARSGGRRLLASGVMRLTALLSAAAICAGMVQFRLQHTLAYAVSYLGDTIGYVADPQVVEDGTARAQQLMQFFSMEDRPKLSYAVAKASSLSDAVDLSNAIIRCHSDELAQASGLFIDGAYMGAIADRSSLESLLDSLRTANEDGTESRPSAFVQQVEITDGAYPRETLISIDTLRTKLESARNEPVYHTVQSGDTLIGIARSCGLTLSELRTLNPAFSASDLLHIGDRLMIKASTALLQARVYRKITYTEPIPYETKVWQDANHYIGEQRILVRGVNGEQNVVAEVELTDGVETARTILETTVTKAPVTKKMQVGSKKGARPQGSGYATGTFAWPLPGYTTITSPYGRRWGTVHQGIDISGYNVYGKSIAAADGGIVYAVNASSRWGAGMFAGYGYAVIIDHGNGLKTLYAHCSAVAVQAGQRVSKGQTIAYVGSTGNSTGPHLHFEVRVNNTRLDPMPYLLH